MAAQTPDFAQNGAIKKALVAATTNAAGGVLSLVNPEGVDLFITKLVIDVTKVSTGAATVDAGVASTVASNDLLIDGADVNAAVATFGSPYGTHGVGAVKWKAGEYLTITASASVAGMEGYAYVEYMRA